jgi:hypothetical protein
METHKSKMGGYNIIIYIVLLFTKVRLSILRLARILYINTCSRFIYLKTAHKKSIKVGTVSLIGVVIIIFIIILFAILFKLNTPLDLQSSISFSDYIYYSSLAYFTGGDNILANTDSSNIKTLFIIENFVSLVTNNIYLGLITYNIFKAHNHMKLSNYMYILEREGEEGTYVLRFRIADVNNKFINFSYNIVFFDWFENKFKDPYYEIEGKIPEMEYLYNEDLYIIANDNKVVKHKKIAPYLLKKFSETKLYWYNTQIMCITISAISLKTGESVLIKRYYGKNDIKFVGKCSDVYMWSEKFPHKTPRKWFYLNQYTPMSIEEKTKFMNKLKDTCNRWKRKK